jgi:hypothetical protein
MVKKVGVDQVILFSLPMKKGRLQDTEGGMPGRNRSIPAAGNYHALILLPFKKMKDS